MPGRCGDQPEGPLRASAVDHRLVVGEGRHPGVAFAVGRPVGRKAEAPVVVKPTLMTEAAKLGLKPGFSILDAADTGALTQKEMESDETNTPDTVRV